MQQSIVVRIVSTGASSKCTTAGSENRLPFSDDISPSPAIRDCRRIEQGNATSAKSVLGREPEALDNVVVWDGSPDFSFAPFRGSRSAHVDNRCLNRRDQNRCQSTAPVGDQITRDTVY